MTIASVTVSSVFFLFFFLYEGNIFCLVPPADATLRGVVYNPSELSKMFRGIPADATFRGVVYNPSELPKMIRGITGKKFASIF